MNETKKKITEYTKMMAGIKEKVVATLVLFVVSAVMMTTVSFAWLTMSRNPEVTGVSTTVATNGNLEIALCPADGSLPAESSVGDAKLPIVQKNNTWGNLINLSAEEYGLENMILRPAVLNVNGDLLESPLKAAKYDEDGRVIGYISDFGYAMWQTATSTKPAYFAVKEGFGVRALASLSYKDVGGDMAYYEMVSNVESLQEEVIGKYTELTGTKYIDSIAAIMGDFLSAKFGSSDGEFICEYSDVETLYGMLGLFVECYELEAKAMAGLMNLQLFIVQGEKYKAIDEDTFLNNLSDIEKILTDNKLYKGTVDKTGKIIYDEESFSIQELSVFVADFNTVRNDFAKMEAILADETNKDNKAVNWNNSLKDENGKTIASMNDIVMHLVNINTCTVNGTPVSSVGMSNALSVVNIMGNNDAVIKEGILKRFEDIIGNRLGGGKGVTTTIPATIKGLGAKIKATIKTAAPLIGNFECDFEDVKSLSAGAYKDLEYIADDTYGFAVDFFVRTNADESFLTLQGNILTHTEEVFVKGKDPNQNEVQIYTIEVPGDENNTETIILDVYQVNNTWYNAYTHETINLPSNIKPEVKVEQITTAIGYEGDNRIWNSDDNNEFLSVNSTTQGSGSCYVFYTDDPIEQDRCINLLKYVKVIFLDETGEILATASLNTDYSFEENGRVLVPLIVDSDSELCIGQDLLGNDIYAITPLERNVPTRITAIVYLHGGNLTNADVLSSAEIHGRLNIQFGSTVLQRPIENEELKSKEIIVTGSVTKDAFDFDVDNDFSTGVEITISGVEPSSVSVFFTRVINSTQGTREEEITLQPIGDGKWYADYTFSAPGTYIIRSVFVNGIERELSNIDLPKVVIDGFNISDITWTPGVSEYSYLSASEFYSTEVNVIFSATSVERMPSTVKGVFKKDDGSSVVFNFAHLGSGVWSSQAEFYSSGEYTLDFLMLDGELVAISEEKTKTLSLSLGISVKIYTDSLQEFTLGKELEQGSPLIMRVELYDEANNMLRGITGVSLTYSSTTSSAITMHDVLIWDEEKSCYIGELPVENAGYYVFSNIKLLGNTIYKADISPKFNIIPPDSISFNYANANSYQFCLTNVNSAIVTIALDKAASPYIVPVFRNTWLESSSDSKDVYIYGKPKQPSDIVSASILTDLATTDSDSYTCVAEIEIPLNNLSLYKGVSVDKAINGKQDGEWELYSVLVFNVYYGEDDNKTFYPWQQDWNENTDFSNIDNKLEFKISEENDYNKDGVLDPVKSTVVSTVFMESKGNININNVPLSYDDNVNYKDGYSLLGASYDGNNLNRTGLFMDSYDLSGFAVVVCDFRGEQIKPDNYNVLESFTLKYKLETGSTETHGDYKREDGTIITEEINITLKYDTTEKCYKQDDTTVTMNFAGRYGLYLSKNMFTGIDNDISLMSAPNYIVLKNALPGFRVYSVSPSVGITSFDPSGTFHYNKSSGKEGYEEITLNPLVEPTNSVTVYLECTEKSIGCFGKGYYFDSPVKVDMKINNIGSNFKSASLPFTVAPDSSAKEVYMYTESTTSDRFKTSEYVWTPENSTTSRYIGYVNEQNKTAAGKLEAKQLIVTTLDGNKYLFTIIPTITINNPY